ASTHGPHVDNRGLPALPEQRQGLPDQLGGGEKIYLHHLPEHRLARSHKMSEAAYAGIVDQYIEPPVGLRHRIKQALPVLRASDIPDNRDRFPARFDDLPRERVETILGACR